MPVIFFVFFGKFQVGIFCHAVPAQQDQATAFVFQRCFIQLVEEKDNVRNLNYKLRLLFYISFRNIIQENINDQAGNLRFKIIQPAVMYLIQKRTPVYNIQQFVNIFFIDDRIR